MSAVPDHSTDQDWAAFSALDHMVNHWDRPGWHPGRSAYYWYLSFRNEPSVKLLARQCKSSVSGPEFDPVDYEDLHMTLERLGFAEEVPPQGLASAMRAASVELSEIEPIAVQVGPLAGSSGAVSFSASPADRLREVRARLVKATHAAGMAQDVAVTDPFRPHVGIGYCNRETEAGPIVDRVRQLRSIPPVTVHIRNVALVELVRHERAYSWHVVHEVPLAGGGEH